MVQNTGRAGAYASQWQKYLEMARQDEPVAPKPDHAADKKSAELRTKLDLGKRLTPEEKSYLKRKNPDLYATANKLEIEQYRYKKALRGCRTKADRKKLKFDKTMLILCGARVRGPDGTDANNTLARLAHIREAERQGRFSRWA